MNISPEIIWLLASVLLVFSEFMIPGLVIAFFGGGALITALTTWLGFTSTLELQLLVFIVSSILLLVVLRAYVKKIFLGRLQQSGDIQNFSIEVGKIVPVVELIEPGEVGGKVRYQGALWSAKADEKIPPGESVKIKGFDNLTLIVEKKNKEE
jgi:membrane protein implicated in regulation of membrane protease activity